MMAQKVGRHYATLLVCNIEFSEQAIYKAYYFVAKRSRADLIFYTTVSKLPFIF